MEYPKLSPKVVIQLLGGTNVLNSFTNAFDRYNILICLTVVN